MATGDPDQQFSGRAINRQRCVGKFDIESHPGRKELRQNDPLRTAAASLIGQSFATLEVGINATDYRLQLNRSYAHTSHAANNTKQALPWPLFG